MLLQTLVQLHILISAAPALAGWAACWHVAPVLPAQTVRVASYQRAAPAAHVRAVHQAGEASACQAVPGASSAACVSRAGAAPSRVFHVPASRPAAAILLSAPRAP